MITPNISIKLVSICFFIFGILSFIFLENLNKVLGVFMIIYSVANIMTLQHKGNKHLKLSVLKLNQVVLTLFIMIYSLLIINKNIHDNTILVIPIFTLILIINFSAIKAFTMIE
jgi:hypothetical protein